MKNLNPAFLAELAGLDLMALTKTCSSVTSSLKKYKKELSTSYRDLKADAISTLPRQKATVTVQRNGILCFVSYQRKKAEMFTEFGKFQGGFEFLREIEEVCSVWSVNKVLLIGELYENMSCRPVEQSVNMEALKDKVCFSPWEIYEQNEKKHCASDTRKLLEMFEGTVAEPTYMCTRNRFEIAKAYDYWVNRNNAMGLLVRMNDFSCFLTP